MPEENPSIMNHVSLAVTDPEKSFAFYDAVLAVVGGKRIMEHDGTVAYGKLFPEFWVHGKTFDGGKAETANGIHFAFNVNSVEELEAFHKAGLDNGGTDDGVPGQRPQYGEPYYGCFLRDPDGHKIEAVFWNEPLPS